MNLSLETIAAIATPAGDGAVGIVRLSGPKALELAELFFQPASGKALRQHAPRTLVAGAWKDPYKKEVLDEVLCVHFKAPASFTGEDVVEVQAHGGGFHLRGLLQALVHAGARLARPGEFTQRAFLNGKIDLTRAEAVADLIASRTQLSRQVAARQLAGGLFERVDGLRKAVLDILAQVEAAVDFPEEEEQLLPKQQLLKNVRETHAAMGALLATARTGKLLREGMRLVICGRPNVGKSSLLNQVLGSARAIVTDVAGTTRDFLEEPFQIEGFPLLLVDTAGLRKTFDPVEAQGVERSREQLKQAELLLLVLDGSMALSQEDHDLVEELKQRGQALFCVINKCDLPAAWDASKETCLNGRELFKVSAKSGQGLQRLKQAVLDFALGQEAGLKLNQALLTQARHEEALRRAQVSLGHVADTLAEGRLSAEFLSGDLRECLDALGEIVGATTRQEVLDTIFSKFCIGK